jgi:methyltransferase (TIGR00027 family)
MKAPGLLTNVGDTARWVAYLRAMESARADALFRDPHALRLAGERGRRIARQLPSGTLLWSLAIRTRVYDEWLLEVLSREHVTTVLNLAAGFDARPYRLALPADLRWIEIDLPEIIADKQALLSGERAACDVERIGLDLADRGARQALFTRLRDRGEPTLLITEGLLIYLDEDSVASLADDMHATFAQGIWLLENVAPSILARQRALWGEPLRRAHAEHKFAPDNGWEFFRSRGWRSIGPIKSLFDEARRLGRETPGLWLTRRLAPARYARLRESVQYAIMRPEPPTDAQVTHAPHATCARS